MLPPPYGPTVPLAVSSVLLKARTYTPTFAALESVLESADSRSESADSTSDFMIVCQLPVSNMFNISTLIQSRDQSQLTIAVGRLQISLVGMGLKCTALLIF